MGLFWLDQKKSRRAALHRLGPLMYFNPWFSSPFALDLISYRDRVSNSGLYRLFCIIIIKKELRENWNPEKKWLANIIYFLASQIRKSRENGYCLILKMDGEKCFVLCSQLRLTWFCAYSDMLSIPYTFAMWFEISLSAILDPSNMIIITTLAPEWKLQTT